MDWLSKSLCIFVSWKFIIKFSWGKKCHRRCCLLALMAVCVCVGVCAVNFLYNLILWNWCCYCFMLMCMSELPLSMAHLYDSVHRFDVVVLVSSMSQPLRIKWLFALLISQTRNNNKKKKNHNISKWKWWKLVDLVAAAAALSWVQFGSRLGRGLSSQNERRSLKFKDKNDLKRDAHTHTNSAEERQRGARMKRNEFRKTLETLWIVQLRISDERKTHS